METWQEDGVREKRSWPGSAALHESPEPRGCGGIRDARLFSPAHASATLLTHGRVGETGPTAHPSPPG